MDLYDKIEEYLSKYKDNYYPLLYDNKLKIFNLPNLPANCHHLSIYSNTMIKFETTLHENFKELFVSQNKKLIVFNVVVNRKLNTLRIDNTNVKKLKLNLTPSWLYYDREKIKNSKTFWKSAFYNCTIVG